MIHCVWHLVELHLCRRASAHPSSIDSDRTVRRASSPGPSDVVRRQCLDVVFAFSRVHLNPFVSYLWPFTFYPLLSATFRLSRWRSRNIERLHRSDLVRSPSFTTRDMATTSSKQVILKDSFAKVRTHGQSSMMFANPSASSLQVAAHNPARSLATTAMTSSASSFDLTDPSSTNTTTTSRSSDPPASQPIEQIVTDALSMDSVSDLQHLNEAAKGLRIKDEGRSSTSKSSPEAGTPAFSSELSAHRPPSVDGKSTASGTTFALDEKESLRPDDSASVVAAEEEDTFSAPGSAAANSRFGSESGVRAFRDQLHEVSERMGDPPRDMNAGSARPGPPVQAEASSHGEVSEAQRSVTSGPSAGLTTAAGAAIPFGFSQSGPDEKLLEALESPKDRLFLLRLEQDVVEFVKDSKEPMLDLPPCNSFCRLLIHKLADYYYLTHFVDAAANSIRIYRTPFCRL